MYGYKYSKSRFPSHGKNRDHTTNPSPLFPSTVITMPDPPEEQQNQEEEKKEDEEKPSTYLEMAGFAGDKEGELIMHKDGKSVWKMKWWSPLDVVRIARKT
jgi:hypothetical protein